MKEKHSGSHLYFRIKYPSGAQVFRCRKAGCTHFINSKELLIGRRAECWRCGKEFTIDEKSALLKKPHCIFCTKGRADKEKEKMDVLEELLRRM